MMDSEDAQRCPVCGRPAVLEARVVAPHGSPDVPRDRWPVVTCCRTCHGWWLARVADAEAVQT